MFRFPNCKWINTRTAWSFKYPKFHLVKLATVTLCCTTGMKMFGAVILGFAVIVNSQAGVSKISIKIIILNGCVQYNHAKGIIHNAVCFFWLQDNTNHLRLLETFILKIRKSKICRGIRLQSLHPIPTSHPGGGEGLTAVIATQSDCSAPPPFIQLHFTPTSDPWGGSLCAPDTFVHSTGWPLVTTKMSKTTTMPLLFNNWNHTQSLTFKPFNWCSDMCGVTFLWLCLML